MPVLTTSFKIAVSIGGLWLLSACAAASATSQNWHTMHYRMEPQPIVPMGPSAGIF